MDAAGVRGPGPDEAERRRARLRDAGLSLWAADGWAAVTLSAVGAATGLSAAEVAAEYPTADELLGDIFDDGTEERSAAVIVAMQAAGAPLVGRVRACLEAIATSFEADPRQAVVLIEAVGCPTLRDRRRIANRGFATLIAGEMAQAGIPVPREQLTVAAHFCLGGLAELVLAWQDEGTRVDRTLLVEHGTLLFEACLTAH